jgi:hypothetical protein
MKEPLSSAAGSSASSSAAAPVWEPSFGPATDAPVEFPGPEVDQDPLPTTTPASELGASQPVVPVRHAPRARRSRSVPVLLSFAAVVAVAGLGFSVGRVSAPAQTNSAVGQNGALNGLPGANASGLPGGDRGAGFGGSTSVTGTVVSISASSMTLQLAGGQTVQIATGTSTTYHNQTAATSSDVAAGNTVQVQVSGGNAGPNAAASASAGTGTRTATDVTVTGP